MSKKQSYQNLIKAEIKFLKSHDWILIKDENSLKWKLDVAYDDRDYFTHSDALKLQKEWCLEDNKKDV